MRLLGWEITRKAAPPGTSPVNDFSRGWWPIVREPFTGAWQRNLETTNETVLTYHAVYSCVTLIASDVSKCRLKLVQQTESGVWMEFKSSAFSPVIRKPNHWQNRIKFYEQWTTSKLLHGNTYVLLGRDERKVVTEMYILDPTRVKVLIAPDGSVWYELNRDNLSGLGEDRVAVPASEIIHDVMTPLYHPLCGVSPLTACAIPAAQGLAIQANSGRFFANGSMPGGILTAPGHINDETAARLKTHWDQKFAGNNVGKIAVLGDGLKFEQLAIRAIDAQLIEQLKWTAETVCSAFHVPSFMVGVGQPPAYNNIEALNQQYYSQCLQKLFECIELCLDEGLGLTDVKEVPIGTYGTEFDLDNLLRMDTRTLVEAEARAVGAGIKAPDESRLRLNLGPVKGGQTPYLQQQNYSLAALDERDRGENPFNKPEPAAALPPPPPPENEEPEEEEDVAKRLVMALQAKMINDRIPA